MTTYRTNEALALQITEAFCTAILIKYGRAFGSGVRKIDKRVLLADLPKKILESHEYFLAWRDKHLAHSVNNFERGKIQARYCAERVHSEGIADITVGQLRLGSLSTDELEELAATSRFFIDRLENMIRAEKEKVLALVRALPVSEVLAKDEPATVPFPDRKSAKRSRKKG